MFALRTHVYQTFSLEPIQVHARGGCANPADHSQFGAGSGAAIGQAVEHTGSRRLAYRGRDARSSDVRMINIHIVSKGDAWRKSGWGAPRMRRAKEPPLPA